MPVQALVSAETFDSFIAIRYANKCVAMPRNEAPLAVGGLREIELLTSGDFGLCALGDLARTRA